LFISKRALKWWGTRQSPRPRWYFDIKLIHDYASVTHRYRHTAPISMFYALREALLVIAEEGAENRWAVIAGDTVSVPSGIDDAKARKRLFDD
jgi:alanine-glyoxylate transaminase/serine-glyoxylate transaminase/serine-pyruvate transaminase